MTSPETATYPKLRALDMTPIQQGGQALILLRDPLALTEKSLVIPSVLGPILGLCDGTRDESGLSAALAIRFGQRISTSEVHQLITALDESLFLENERSQEALIAAQEEFRHAPYRPPILAGVSYPEDPSELRIMLQGYLDDVDAPPSPHEIRGLISPHIDYERGGSVYAEGWGRAQEAVRETNLAIIFGTNHFGSDYPLTMTRQSYATPFGILPTNQEVVDALAKSAGEEDVFAGELYHKGEHSIELTAVWLHHMRDGSPIELVPVLSGSYEQFFGREDDLGKDLVIQQMADVVKSASKDQRVLVIAAGDLSHVGPAFGGLPVDFMGRARVQATDEELIAHICAGDAQAFFEGVSRIEDRNNVCGLSPIYLTMRMLSPVSGEQVAYDRCPADLENTSIVSICSMHLY